MMSIVGDEALVALLLEIRERLAVEVPGNGERRPRRTIDVNLNEIQLDLFKSEE